MIEIFLAGVPVGKQRVARSGGDGHAYTPERTVTFEGRLAYAAQHVMKTRPLFAGTLVVDIVVLVPIPVSKPEKWKRMARSGEIRPGKKPDFDNFAKVIDALNLIVWVDDALIVRGVIDKFYHDRPLYAVRVRPTDDRDRVMPSWVSLKHNPPTEGIFA